MSPDEIAIAYNRSILTIGMFRDAARLSATTQAPMTADRPATDIIGALRILQEGESPAPSPVFGGRVGAGRWIYGK